MYESLNIHEPLLVNTLGHCAGVLLFSILFILLLQDQKGRRGDAPVLSATAALLALLWNVASLAALRGPFQTSAAALGFAAFSLLPAVLLAISLRGRALPLRAAGWTVSIIAVCLHFVEMVTGNGGLHQAALLLISVGFGLLAVAAAIWMGPQNISRILVPIALLVFAMSFVHFGEAADGHFWSRELALHHAGIPLALFIVLQDYRFLLADVFLRALATGVLAAAFTLAVLLSVERWGIWQAASSDPFVAGLFIAGICCALVLFSHSRRFVEETLTRYLFRRRGLSAVLAELESRALPDGEREICEVVGERMADHVRAAHYELRDGISAGLFVPQLMDGPDLPKASAPWAEAVVPIRLSGADGYMVLLGRRQGGRRYLSGDLDDLSRFALHASSRVERFRSQQRDRLAARAELRALQSQINPHFLFNSLNALYGSIPRSAAAARRAVINLSDIFRYFLSNDRSQITLAEELRIIRAYLEIEQLRLGDRLRTEIDVEDEALRLLIPALSIEPLVENAVKHGVGNQPGPGLVSLHVRCDAGGLDVAVCDTGPGFPVTNGNERQGVGLENVRQRLLLNYGQVANLVIDTNEGGTSVRFRIPR